jgi:hypothetical protein
MLVEAGCLEWALLVGVVLRDAMAVVRVVNTASMLDTPIEVIGRMREGLSFMQRWADTEWYVTRPPCLLAALLIFISFALIWFKHILFNRNGLCVA